MHYVIGDVHGHYTCLMELLNKLNLTKEDKVILVGDICDRAPTPLEQKLLIDWAYENIKPDDQFQMVIGNHEYEHARDIEKIKEMCERRPDDFNWPDQAYELLKHMDHTYHFYKTCDETGIDFDEFVAFVNKLPLFIRIDIEGHKPYLITHSWLSTLKLEGPDELIQEKVTEEDFDISLSVWNREESVVETPAYCTVIHGHTPTICEEYFYRNPSLTPKIMKSLGNVNVDCGLYGQEQVGNGNLAAYCLETKKAIYLYENAK